MCPECTARSGRLDTHAVRSCVVGKCPNELMRMRARTYGLIPANQFCAMHHYSQDFVMAYAVTRSTVIRTHWKGSCYSIDQQIKKGTLPTYYCLSTYEYHAFWTNPLCTLFGTLSWVYIRGYVHGSEIATQREIKIAARAKHR